MHETNSPVGSNNRQSECLADPSNAVSPDLDMGHFSVCSIWTLAIIGIHIFFPMYTHTLANTASPDKKTTAAASQSSFCA